MATRKGPIPKTACSQQQMRDDLLRTGFFQDDGQDEDGNPSVCRIDNRGYSYTICHEAPDEPPFEGVQVRTYDGDDDPIFADWDGWYRFVHEQRQLAEEAEQSGRGQAAR